MDEKLQYELTFKTRAETAPVESVAAKVRDLRAETDRLNSLKTDEKLRANTIAFHDLDAALAKNTAAVRQHTRTQAEDDAERARAIQTVRRIKQELAEEEARLKQLTLAQRAHAAGMNTAKGAGQNFSFQLQDIAVQLQAGTRLSTVLAQQLPQMFSGLGAKGAAAGAVFAIGALIYNLITAKSATDEAKKAAAELEEKLQDLIQLKAEQWVEKYALAAESAERRMKDLAAAEVERLGTLNEIENAQRRSEKAQDDMTAAALRYLAATTGADVSAQLAQLEQKNIQRDAQQATEEQTLRVEQQKLAYEKLNEELERLKARRAELESERQGLDTRGSDLIRRADNAYAMGRQTEKLDLDEQLKKVFARAKQIDDELASIPGRLQEVTDTAFARASEIDAVLATADANIKAINAEAEGKMTAQELEASLQQTRDITSGLTAALAEVQVSNPAQAEAAQTLRNLLADGAITANEIAAATAALQTLMSTNNNALSSTNSNMDKIIQMLQSYDATQRKHAKLLEGLINRQ